MDLLLLHLNKDQLTNKHGGCHWRDLIKLMTHVMTLLMVTKCNAASVMCSLQSDWSQSCDQLFITFDEWPPLSLYILEGCQLESSFISWTHQHNNNSRLHINSNTWSQQASGSSDWLTVVSLSVFLSNPEACLHSPLTASLRSCRFTGNTGSLILTVFRTILMKAAWTDWNPLLTSESPVYSLDSSQDQEAASLLNPSGCFHSGSDVSDGRGWTSELVQENHSWSLTNHRSTIWIKNKRWNDWWSIRCVKVLNVSSSMCVLTRNEAQHYTVI